MSSLRFLQFQQQLQTLTFELNHERSIRSVEAVSKDEDIRKLRLQLLLLEDENEELHNQLVSEEERSDNLEQDRDDALLRVGELGTELQEATNDIRLQTRELESLKVFLDLCSLLIRV